MPRNDVQATAGLDLSNVEAGLKILVERLDALESHASKASEGVEKIATSATVATKALDGFKTVLNALGISFGVAAVVDLGKKFFSLGADIKYSSETAQLGIEQYQRLKQELTGFVGADEAEKSIQGIASALREARNQNPEVIQQFRNLGISWEELSNPATDAKTIIESLATSYQQASDKTEFLRKATNFFGEDFLKLVPALEQGGEALNKIGNEATVASTKIVDAAVRGQQQWEKFGQWLQSTFFQTVDQATTKFEKMVNDAKSAAGVVSNLRNIPQGPLRPAESGILVSGASAEINQVSTGNQGELFSPQGTDQTPKVGTDKAGLSPAGIPKSGAAQGVDPLGGPRRIGGDTLTPSLITDALKLANSQADQGANLLEVQEKLNDAEAHRNVTLKSQLDLLDAEQKSYSDQAAILEKLGDHLGAQAALIKANESAITRSNLEFQAGQESISSQYELGILQLRLEGQNHLASVAEIEAKWQGKIAVALREQKGYLVDQYTTAENLEIIQATAVLYQQSNATAQAAITQSVKDQLTLQQAINATNEQSASDANTNPDGSPKNPNRPFGFKNSKGFIPKVGQFQSADNVNDNVFGFGNPNDFGIGDLGSHHIAPKAVTPKPAAPKAPANPIIQAQSIQTPMIQTKGIKPG
jgi:hypothetical protein